MVKNTPGDLKAILRLFNIEGADNSTRHVKKIVTVHPSPTSKAILFRFEKKRYCVLYDETADDDIDYLTSLINDVVDSGSGNFIRNPAESNLTYGVPFKGKTIYIYLAQPDKQRLDIYLTENNPELSRSLWQKQIKSGKVSINGKVVSSPKYEVLPSDEIKADLPKKTDYSDEELPILYIDDNVIVVNKPIGILSHSKAEFNDGFTVADFLRRYTKVGLETNRPGIVHRLDRDTSGVLIGARNEASSKLLSRQFSDRKVKKTYIAVLSGHLKAKQAVIELPIERNPSKPSTFRVAAGGRMAVTHYKVIAEVDGESLLELRPVTGRTHQLRVHMAYLGTPIKGDRIYGRASDRLYLHAKSLEITIPTSDRRIFETPLPESFTNNFKKPYDEYCSEPKN